jgi:hypothetical protein
VLRLLLLLHVGGGLAALVLVADLDRLFAGRLIACGGHLFIGGRHEAKVTAAGLNRRSRAPSRVKFTCQPESAIFRSQSGTASIRARCESKV